MSHSSPRSVEAIFHDARSHPAGPERDAYLAGACGEDLELRGRVEALLSALEGADGSKDRFLERPALELPASSAAREGPGTRIGVYKLLQEIGEGGMGVVYMAEQEEPVRRKVALKVIKLGMDTKQVIARFEAERQALAMMDHENIARVLDAGATETGRLFFVMELVRGVPIHEYCDTQRLSTGARLALFMDVCRAVQHAHQKGIIHRDLKPTNVLVTSYDGVPVPKIIDFGVAKATHQRLTDRTLFTEFHQVIGTPEYMSPEQAEMSGLDVDTRSDIYSLGVLMYQLLTGSTPVDAVSLRTAGFEEMTRIIREEDPAAPSTRVSKLGLDAQSVAAKRSSDLRTLSRRLRGDLDWIVMKALEKDRTRRYETAAAFASDVQRHLEDRPVEAGPPSLLYRASKFVRRNRRGVGAAAVILLLVALGLAGTVSGFLRAKQEAERSSRVGAALEEVLTVDGAAAENRDALEAVLGNVRAAFGEDHVSVAAVLDTLARQQYEAGQFETAASLGREALGLWTDAREQGAPTRVQLGRSLRAMGEGNAAEAVLRETLDILGGDGPAHARACYDARLELAELLVNRGEYIEADQLLAEALALLRSDESAPHFKIIRALERRLEGQLAMPGADARGTLLELYQETHAFYPEDSPALAMAALGYGRYLARNGDEDASEPFLREALARFNAAPDPPRMYLFACTDQLFQVLRRRTDPETVVECDQLVRRLTELGETFLGPLEIAANLKYLATRLFERGEHIEALRTILAGHQRLVAAGATGSDLENLRDNMTMLAFNVARVADQGLDVYELAREAALSAALEEPDHPAMAVAHAMALYRLGQYDAAASELVRVERPLSETRGGLARRMAPADHAVGAMVHARLEDRARAEAELALIELFLFGSEQNVPELVLEARRVVAAMTIEGGGR